MDDRREGYEQLPEDGPAILCPNHISFLDSAFLMLTLPRNISFVGKAEYMDSWKTKYLFPAMGMIPIDRSGGDKSQAALDAAEEVLRRGELFGIFPEGTRSRDGYLLQGPHRRGPAGARGRLPDLPGRRHRHRRDPAPRRQGSPSCCRSCTIHDRPADPTRALRAVVAPSTSRARSMIDEVMFEIREMTGQTYKNVYAGTPDTEDTVHAKVATVADEAAPEERELVGATR